MSDLRQTAQQALEALEDPWKAGAEGVADAITALRAALRNEFNPDWDQVEALQESLREHMAEIQRLRAALAEPERQPLTDEEIDQIAIKCLDSPEPGWNRNLARAIERAHGIGEAV